MKHRLIFVFLLFATSCLWAQSPQGFEGAWIGSAWGNQPQTWVFENIHDNTCPGFFWIDRRFPWSKCEIKNGELTVWWQGTDPALTGKIISPTQLELAWHNIGSGVHTFIATKQPPEYRKTLGDPRELARVDRNRMGIYRAMAEVIMDSVNKKDMVTAAKISRVLEVAWDRAETDLQNNSREAWGRADTAMDQLVFPVMNYLDTPLDIAKVEATYHTYLDRLKEAQAAIAAKAAK
jgi:hypothetical protein